MNRFFKFIAHTPVMGEEQTFYCAIPEIEVGGFHILDEDYLNDVCINFAEINCDDWWDEDHAQQFEEDDYYGMAYCEGTEVSYAEARPYLGNFELEDTDNERP